MRNKAKYCFLISHGIDDRKGWCSARLVEPVFRKEGADFTIGIGTLPDSRKVDELWDNPKVTLAFENPREDANLVVYGGAFVETRSDMKKYYWKKVWKMFFPDGPESENYVVLRIEPSRMEILNFKQNIIPEPFGLKAAVLVKQDGCWQME
jgi:general stress protein 26